MSVTLGEQFAYGHADALLRYLEVESGFGLWAYIPHGGWSPLWPPFYSREYVGKKRTPLGREIPQLLWNSDWAARARLQGAKRAYAIGAPWLYELLNDGVVPFEAATSPAGGTSVRRSLFIPTHSAEAQDVGLDTTLERITGMLSPNEFDILLGWLDFINPRIRTRYEAVGYNLVCAGFRSSATYIPWSPAGGRSVFLSTLREIIEGRPAIVSDSVSTACLYAASINVRVHVLEALRPNETSPTHESQLIEDFLSSEFIWMHRGEDPREHHDQVKEYLGFDNLMSKKDLRELVRLVPTPG